MALTRPKLAQFSTVVSTISDPITVLHAGYSSANVDIGFLMNRANGLVSNVALYWSESSNSFVLGYTSNSGITDANITVSSYASLTTGSQTVNGALTATTINAATIGNIGANIVGSGAYLTSISAANIVGTITAATTAQYVTGLTAANVQGVIGSVPAASFPILNQNTTGNASLVTTASQPAITTLSGLTGFGLAGATTTAAGNFVVTGNLTINGTTSTINNTTIETTEFVQTIDATTVRAVTIGNVGAQGTFGNITTANGLFWANGVNALSPTYGNTQVSAYLPLDPSIVAINASITTTAQAITTANTALKGYVDAGNTVMTSYVGNQVTTANTAMKGYVDAGNTTMTGYVANQVTTANTAMKGYVDSTSNTLVTYVGTQISAANTVMTSYVGNQVTTANTAMKGYVDAANTVMTSYAGNQVSTANTALKGYVDAANTVMTNYVGNQVTTANTAMKGYVDAGNTVMTSYVGNQVSTVTTGISGYYLWANANVGGLYNSIQGANVSISALQANVGSFYTYANATYSTIANAGSLQSQIAGANAAIITANTALKGYVDAANTVMTSYVGNQVTTANTAMKGYVDAVTTAWTANAATQQGQITTLQSQVYTNSNVNAYLSSTGSGNITIASGAFGLTATGPGATTVGSGTAIPVITTDAYGRIVALTTSAVSTTINTTGTTGTGSVSGGGTLTFSSTNGVVVAASGSTLSIATPQNLQTGAAPTFAGLTTSGNTIINSTAYISGVTNITNNTNSSGAGNGALVVTGGIGASGTVNFGSDLYVTGNIYTANLVATTTSTLNTASPMAYFQVTPSYPYNFETGFYSHFVGGPANVYAHTGFVRNHNNNRWVLFSNVKSEPSSTTVNFADSGLLWDALQSGDHIISNTTVSTSTTTGALVVAGGAGIAGNLNVNSAGYFGYNAAATPLINPSVIATSSSQAVNAGQYYVQMGLINNNGTGSSDIVAYPNNTTDGSTGFMDMGFTGNLFADPLYTITKANDGYLFASARTGSALGGNLVLATDATGTFNDIVLATGSFYANAEVGRLHGNVSTNGNFALKYTTPSTSTTTGAFQVAGGVGVAGNVYAGAVYTSGLFWSANGAVISTGGGTGIKYTAATSAPINPTVGDQWYFTTSDILYEYQNVGTGSFWVDITSPIITSGNVTIPGGDVLSPFLLMGA